MRSMLMVRPATYHRRVAGGLGEVAGGRLRSALTPRPVGDARQRGCLGLSRLPAPGFDRATPSEPHTVSVRGVERCKTWKQGPDGLRSGKSEVRFGYAKYLV